MTQHPLQQAYDRLTNGSASQHDIAVIQDYDLNAATVDWSDIVPIIQADEADARADHERDRRAA